MFGFVWTVVGLAIGGISTFGPTWVEDGLGAGLDAGSTPPVAQLTTQSQPVTRIRGQLEGLAAGVTVAGLDPEDFEDMYAIQIVEPTIFSATTVPELGGMADFDSRLFLFDEDGNPLLGNDDTAIDTLQGMEISDRSTLTNMSSDGTTIIVLQEGIYFLAITVSPRVPRDANGDPLFEFDESTEVSGPDGPGGDGPIEAWQPEPNGACCLTSAVPTLVGGEITCEVITEVQCVTFGGTYLGDDTDCIDCFPTGACCITIGAITFAGGDGCQVLTEMECNDLGGSYQGDATDCTACDPIGACCLDVGTALAGLGPMCQILTEADCGMMGGLYQGDDTDCTACDPIGACCVTIGISNGASNLGACIEVTAAACEDTLGIYQGNGTDCSACEPTGGCCLGDALQFASSGQNCEILTASECSLMKGEYQGDFTDCSLCVPTGACCVNITSVNAPSAFECTIETELDCVGSLGGTYLGDDAICEPSLICDTVTGACCFDGKGPFCDGPYLEDECVSFGGIFQGVGSSCLTVNCDIGACCLPDASCSEGVSASACFQAGGLYQGPGSSCAGVTCPIPATGACCFFDETCLELTEIECDLSKGLYQGDGTTCSFGSCVLLTQASAPLATAGPVTGEYEILLAGVAPSGPDCDENGEIDLSEVAPEYDPALAMVADECADAQFVGPGFVYTGDTTGLTTSGMAMTCGPRIGLFDGWYAYRATWTGLGYMSVNGPPLNFLIEVYDGCPDVGGMLIDCNDVNPFGVVFEVERGRTYYVRFAGQTFGTGPFALTFNGPPALLNPLDFDMNGVPDACDCLEDANDDGVVSFLDFIFVNSRLGPCPSSGGCPADIDGNGMVDAEDLRIVLSADFEPCIVFAPLSNEANDTGPSASVQPIRREQIGTK